MFSYYQNYVPINLAYIRSRNDTNDCETIILLNFGSTKKVREIESNSARPNGMYSIPYDTLYNFIIHNN